jgi:hypothetical protein
VAALVRLLLLRLDDPSIRLRRPWLVPAESLLYPQAERLLRLRLLVGRQRVDQCIHFLVVVVVVVELISPR